MRFQKKYAAALLIIAVVIINIFATLRLLFAVAYPERVLREVISEYFKTNLNKAVKFEDINIDYGGSIVISDFNISITSDFNDNVSLIKSKKAVADLGFFKLLTGDVDLAGIDFYDSEITFIKKYGRSHIDCLYQILEPDKFIKKMRAAYEKFYFDFHGATIYYRESLRDKQITVELNNIDADLEIKNDVFSYSVSGYSRPYKTKFLRKGGFSCSGSLDVKEYRTFKHRIQVDNIDLSYFNEYLLEHKLADIALSGGGSVDVALVRDKDVLTVTGRAETNSLTIESIPHKYNILSNENLNLDLGLVVNTALNRYSLRKMLLNDDVFSLEASGSYVRNDIDDSVKLKFKTNNIDLSDLSQNLALYKDTEYSGTLQGEGSLSLDFKNKKAEKMRLNLALDRFTLKKVTKKEAEPLVDESSVHVKLTDASVDIDVAARPLQSDMVMTSRTSIDNWIPFKSNTNVEITSKKMNLENLRLALVYLIDRAYATAYQDKRSGVENVPFLQSSLGKFLNNNSVTLKSAFDTVFWGKNARFHEYALNAQLSRGLLSLSEFKLEGYDAKYQLAFQVYFNSDQPYIKLNGRVDDFDLSSFYADIGLKGRLTGKARSDFSYEASIARFGDILDNARGHLNIAIARGEMNNTDIQKRIVKFLRKNGYSADYLETINFEDITISISEQGENFWFSNFGIRGDTLVFNAVGDYLYEGGLTSAFSIMMRKDGVPQYIPLKLFGPILAPCVDVVNKKDSQKLCF
jgi:hypothetical protein